MDTSGTRFFQLSGISGLVLGASYLIIIGVYVAGGIPPSDLNAGLLHLANHAWEWWTILGLSVFTDLLFVPIAISVYITLKDRSATVAGTAAFCIMIFVVTDLALTWPNYSSMITLGSAYQNAANEVEKTQILAAARYASSILDSRLLSVYIILIPSIGLFLFGLVMRGVYGKATSYTAIASGVLGVVSVVGAIFAPDLGMAIILGSVLTTVWSFQVGTKLLKLANRHYTEN